MFDREQFIEDCASAVRQGDRQRAVQEVVARAMTDPAAVLEALGQPARPGPQIVRASDSITILNVTWPAHCVLRPHNHLMWSVMGLYCGRKDNILWRRLPGDGPSRISAVGAKSVSTGDVLLLGKDIVHSVVNPSSRISRAIHIYGGGYFHTPRSEWGPDTLGEKPLDLEAFLRALETKS